MRLRSGVKNIVRCSFMISNYNWVHYLRVQICVNLILGQSTIHQLIGHTMLIFRSILRRSKCMSNFLTYQNVRNLSSNFFKVQDEQDFDERVLKSDKPVIVDFMATWCKPCTLLGPRIKHVVDEKQGEIMFAKVDVDERSEIALNYEMYRLVESTTPNGDRTIVTSITNAMKMVSNHGVLSKLKFDRGYIFNGLRPVKRYYSTGDDSKFTSLKSLPSEEESEFRSIIEKGKTYVDKTNFLSQMLQEDRKFFFLSRPRRFGKSLFVDMLKNYFEGEEKLFYNTLIHRSTLEWLKYPIIRIDFTDGISSFSLDEFRRTLTWKLNEVAESNNIDSINDKMPPEQALSTLIKKLKANTKLNPVILIDEYDAPYSANYGKPEAPAVLEVIQSFFRVIKAQRSNIHMMYFTGSSKMAISEFFTSTTSFDLSMNPRYSAILGFTLDEIKKYFHGHINHVARMRNESVENIYEEMKKWHDGFEFTGSGLHVYNPCSVISYLHTDGREKCFWSKSGGLSTLLMKKLEECPKYAYDHISQYATSSTHPEGKKLIAPKSVLAGHVKVAEDSHKALIAILYTGGYFSIVEELPLNGKIEPYYSLRFSNMEVEIDYITRLFEIIRTTTKQKSNKKIEGMREAFESYNWKRFISHLESIFAETPYPLYRDRKRNEAMFHYQLYLIMVQAGYDTDIEAMTSSGSSDLIVEEPDVVYILECKLEQNYENPLDQCRNQYLKRYMHNEKEIVCIGLKFSRTAEIPVWGVARFSSTGELIEEDGQIRLSNNSTI